MPEGDVVWYTARQLHVALSGRVLTRSDFRVPQYATVSLVGQRVTEAVARGKHLLIRTSGGLSVHTHLKMDGFWRVRPAGTPLGESYKVRLLLANEDWQAAGYLLGITEVLSTSQEHRVTGHLGPDLLAPDWDADEAVRRLSQHPERPIGEALLDQRNLAGSVPGLPRKCCSCGASIPGALSVKSRTWKPWWTSGTACLMPTRRGSGTWRPGTPGPGTRAGYTGARADRADAAAL